MELESVLLRFLHYTDAKMCLSGEELNNDGLGYNKHIIKGANFCFIGHLTLLVA